jgi:O-phospho-L-seryl-tRNASec:L-selenocysteinyl-tRNA synthase
MNDANFKLMASVVDKAYVDQARQARRVTEQLVKNLLAQRAIPEHGWKETSIELLLRELAAMDSNNFPGNVGVGEREGRVFSPLVAARNYGFAHGIGRSGDVMAVQPKAAGSSLVVQLTNHMAAHALRLAGFSNIKNAIVLPTATGMTMTLALIALKQNRPAATHVVWPRIDQKSCLKAIVTAGLVPVVVENVYEGDELRTDLPGVATAVAMAGAENVLCILSTTSCFAPRAHDRLEELAVLAAELGIGHVVNNAYGVLSRTCMGSIAAAAAAGRIDAVIQSTDKNFMVPVGGAVVATAKRPNPKGQPRGPPPVGVPAPPKLLDLCDAISKIYPGRASGGIRAYPYTVAPREQRC